jgi:4-amino-4-deoxy-L-arabinose transferase-like glycosyltransferase
MSPKHSTFVGLTLLLAVAFILRLAAGWAWQSRLEGRFGFGDSESYWQLGRSIAAGESYYCGPQKNQVFRTPGYPVLLAPIFLLTDNDQTAVYLARAEAALFGTLSVLAVWWLTLLLFNRRAAWLAAVAAALYPGAVSMGVFVLSESPFCPLMLLQLILWTLAVRGKTTGGGAMLAFAAGLAGGAATLMRPGWLLFTPLAAGVEILLAFRIRRTDWQSAPHIAVALFTLVGLAVAMAPWWARNARLTGHFVPTTLQVGASLYDGLNPAADGSSNMDFVARVFDGERPRETPSIAAEMELDRRMRDAALEWGRANPGQAARLAGVKFVRLWNIWPNEPSLRRWPLRLAVILTYLPLLIFGIIGAWKTIGRGWPYILCWLPAAYLTLLHVVFVSSIRYREPAMLALLALAAGMMGIGDWESGIGGKTEERSHSCPID